MKYEIGNSYVEFEVEFNEVAINSLFVAPEARGSKLGYKLLDMALDYACKKNMTLALCAEPQEDNITTEALIRYYERFGFESHGDCDQLMSMKR